MNTYNGILIINKPKDITSFKAVEKLRRLLGIKKAGHTGTLDPMATGVLPICLGEATKLSSFIMGQDKVYCVRAKLGQRTDTLDAQGRITQTGDVPKSITDKVITKLIKDFTGEVEQIPPMYSAIKKDGVPLYKMALAGKVEERSARRVKIYDISLKEFMLPYFELIVSCSKGTYIRTLIDDIGERLGTYAHVVELSRLSNGVFTIKDAVGIDGELSRDKMLKMMISPENLVKKIMNVQEISSARALEIAKGTPTCLEGLEFKDDSKPTALLSKTTQGLKLNSVVCDGKILRVFNYGSWVCN